MDKFLSVVRKAHHDFARRARRPEGWDDADDAMSGPAASLKRKLESRFRQILGMLPAHADTPEPAETLSAGDFSGGSKDTVDAQLQPMVPSREANNISHQSVKLHSRVSMDVREAPMPLQLLNPDIQSLKIHWRGLRCGTLWNSGEIPVFVLAPTIVEGLDENDNKTNSISECQTQYRIREYNSTRGWETLDVVASPAGVAVNYEISVVVNVLFEKNIVFSKIRVVIPWTYKTADGNQETNTSEIYIEVE